MFEPVNFVAQSEKVVVLGHEELRIKSTGRVVDLDWAMAFTLREGKVAQFREYDDMAALAEAFGGRVGSVAAGG